MAGGVTIDAPSMGPEESNILNNIMDLISQQKEYNETVLPEYMRQQHYKETKVERGEQEYSKTQQQLKDDWEYIQTVPNIALALNGYKGVDKAKLRGIYEKYGKGSWHVFGKLSDVHFYKNLKTQYEQMEADRAEYAKEMETKWVPMTDEEWYNDPNTTDEERQQWDIYQTNLDKQTKAQAGELPLSESLQEQKRKEFEQLKATFGTITGENSTSAKATDTIGIENLKTFNQRWGQIENAERYGQMNTSAESALLSSGLTTDLANNRIGSLANVGNTSGMQSAYGNMLQPYTAYNQAGYQAQAANAGYQAQQNASRYGLMGTGAATGAMVGGPYGAVVGGLLGYLGGTYLSSSKKYKKNIDSKDSKAENKALSLVKKTKSYEYSYKPEMGMGNEKHLGTIAEDAPDEITNNNKTAINLGDKVELQAMGMKAMLRRIEKLEKRRRIS